MTSYRYRIVAPEDYRGPRLQPVYTGRWALHRSGAMTPVIEPIAYLAYADCELCGGKGFVRSAIEYAGGSLPEWDSPCGACGRRKRKEQGALFGRSDR